MLKDIVIKNRSYRGFSQEEKLSTEQLVELVDFARLTASATNRQPLKYLISNEKSKNEAIFKHTHWAMALKKKVPYAGQEPTSYIVICIDKSIAVSPEAALRDIGIVAQTILLAATEMGFGGCMIGAFNKEDVRNELNLDEKYEVNLILAMGKPCENIVITDATDGKVQYYRDDNDVHYVPKRTLNDLIIE